MEEKIEADIKIAENGMSASLILPAGFDRSSLTPESCESLLIRSGVDSEAIKQETIIETITQAMVAEEGPFNAVIAEATPAVHGTDAYIEWQIAEAQADADEDQGEDKDESEAETSSGKDEEKDSVSFYGQSAFTVVQSGEVLGKVYPEVPGTEGRDVRGKTLASRTAKPLDFKYDESIAIDEQNRLVAQVDGVLMRDRKSAKVSNTLEIDQNVDFSTGNIDFPGNVIVHRSVKDCFTVKARDDIEVRGLIEAATLIAGNNLHAKGGFAGREQGKAEVGGNLFAKYLDAVDSYVTGDLSVEREVINCTTTVQGNIKCPRGTIIGGCTHVSGTAEMMDLGASAQPITELHLGVLPHLDPLIQELQTLTDGLIEERDKLLSEQEMITANSGSRMAPSHKAQLAEINRSMALLQLQLDRAEPSLEKLNEHAESIRTIDVNVLRKVHPNALIICKGYHYRVTNEIKGPVKITSNKRGQLEYQQGESKPKLLSAESELRTAA